MAEDNKDDFLREIDELLLGDLENGGSSLPDETDALGTDPTFGLDDLDLKLDDPIDAEPLTSNPPPLIAPSPPKTKLDALKAALSANEDIDMIRELFEDGQVPNDLRVELWKDCLNVSRRPDTLGSWSGPLDSENQDLIHSQCQEQASKLPQFSGAERDQAAEDMEMVITYYCKTRNIRYTGDCGWPELLVPLLVLRMSRADLFNCFYAIMAKYIPRDCKVDGRPFHLFRLLLLYHDPELCSYLDTKKLAPEIYLQPWVNQSHVLAFKIDYFDYIPFTTSKEMKANHCDIETLGHTPVYFVVNTNGKLGGHAYKRNFKYVYWPLLRSLFACVCGLDAATVMWDHYFTEKDPFFFFFLALVMIVNAKDLAMENKDISQGDLREIIKSLPPTLTADDVDDFFTLAHHYAHKTPQSFRKDYHSLLFGSGRSLGSLATNVSHSLCLPISLQEVVDVNQSNSGDEGGVVKFFVVDCRPVDHFSSGHLPHSHNLDATLLLHSPNDFSVAADRLCTRVKKAGVEKGDHLCFLGSGREQEDQYVNMVVAKFLQKSIPYVSVARGGFLELLALVGSKLDGVLEDYDVEQCRELYSDDHNHLPRIRSDASDSDSESYTRYKERLTTKGARLYAGIKDRSQRLKSKFGGFLYSYKKVEEKHVTPLDKPGKRYRNVHADVFVIADEDDENENPSASSSEFEDDVEHQRKVNISLFSTSPEALHSFPTVEIKDNTEYHSHIVLTSEAMIVLRELSDRAGWARVKHRHKLNSVLKITAKKRHPDVITFKFGTGSGEDVVITHVLRFRIPNTQKVTGTIKNHILKYQAQYSEQ